MFKKTGCHYNKPTGRCNTGFDDDDKYCQKCKSTTRNTCVLKKEHRAVSREPLRRFFRSLESPKKKSGVKRAMSPKQSAWINKVQEYRRKLGITYKQAM